MGGGVGGTHVLWWWYRSTHVRWWWRYVWCRGGTHRAVVLVVRMCRGVGGTHVPLWWWYAYAVGAMHRAVVAVVRMVPWCWWYTCAVCGTFRAVVVRIAPWWWWYACAVVLAKECCFRHTSRFVLVTIRARLLLPSRRIEHVRHVIWTDSVSVFFVINAITKTTQLH